MKTLHLICLLALAHFTFGQVAFLGEHNFNEGGYALLGIPSTSDRNELAESLGAWYTADIATLNAFKAAWVFSEPGEMWACGYHYKIALIKDGVALENFFLNLNCHEIVSEEGYFYFEDHKLEQFTSRLKALATENKKFESLEEARAYKKSLEGAADLLYVPSPAWVKFEGTFSLTYTCSEDFEDCYESASEVIANIQDEIQAKYPSEAFELKNMGGGTSKLFVEVSCNQTLMDKFGLYGPEANLSGWKPFSPSLVSYWKGK